MVDENQKLDLIKRESEQMRMRLFFPPRANTGDEILISNLCPFVRPDVDIPGHNVAIREDDFFGK